MNKREQDKAIKEGEKIWQYLHKNIANKAVFQKIDRLIELELLLEADCNQ